MWFLVGSLIDSEVILIWELIVFLIIDSDMFYTDKLFRTNTEINSEVILNHSFTGIDSLCLSQSNSGINSGVNGFLLQVV